MLSVAARFFDRDAWTDNLQQQDDNGRGLSFPREERQESTLIKNYKAERQVLSLNQIILIYLGSTTTDLKPGSGYPVLVAGSQRSNGAATKYIGGLFLCNTSVQALIPQ